MAAKVKGQPKTGRKRGAPPGNNNAEKWTEEKALEIGANLINWLYEKDENVLYRMFLVKNNLYRDVVQYLCRKYDLFFDYIKKAKEIQELKLNDLLLKGNINQTGAIFTLKVHHDYIETQNVVAKVEHETTFDYGKLADGELRQLKELIEKSKNDDGGGD